MASGFKIADGYVEIHGEVDRASIRRAAGEAGEDAGREFSRGSERASRGSDARRSRDGFFRNFFTPDPGLLRVLMFPMVRAFATPLGLAAGILGLMFVTSLVATIVGALAIAAIPIAFAGLAAFILKDNALIKKDFEKLTTQIKTGLATAAAPMIPAFRNAIAIVGQLFTEQLQPKIANIFKNIAPTIGPLTAALTETINRFLAEISKAVESSGFKQFMNDLTLNLPRLGEAIGGFFRILAENGDSIGKAFGIAVSILSNLITVLAWAIVIASSWLIGFAALWHGIQAVTTGAWNFIVAVVMGAVNFIRGLLDGLIRWGINTFTTGWATMVAITRGAISMVLGAINGLAALPGRIGAYFQGAVSAAGGAIGNLVSLAASIPGRIQGAIGNLGGLLVNAGRQVVQGLINGIMAMIPNVASVARTVANTIAGFLPGSPVETGPLTVLNRGYAGKQIVKMVTDGMRMQPVAPTVQQVVTPIARSVVGQGSGGGITRDDMMEFARILRNTPVKTFIGTREVATSVFEFAAGEVSTPGLAVT